MGTVISLNLLLILVLVPVASAQGSVSLYYFYAEDCPHCRAITVLLEELEERYPELEVHHLEISSNTTNSELFNAFILVYNPPAVDIPAVFIGNTSVIGYELTEERLENEIAFCVQHKCTDPLSRVAGKEEQSPPLILVVGTALIEGINPCGFAVFIVLLASLLFLKSKRTVLYVGLAFIASVFTAHLFVGFGIMEFYLFSGMNPFARTIAILVIVSAGIINMLDFWRGTATLAIPSSLKPTLRKLASYASVPGAVLLGFLTTLVGLPCTGPIYLTMLDMIADIPSKTVFYLLLYNLFYALPLFVLLALIYKGTLPEDVDQWRKGKRKYMKLIAGIVMLALGAAMLFGFF
jgi:cytochrome c biogenesis protein CcdA/glutaredoxin